MEINLEKIKTISDWINLFRLSWTENGKKRVWDFVSRKEKPDILTKSQTVDAVVIAAVHKDKKGEKSLVVIKEFRYPIGDYEWGFPAGIVDPNESPEDAAKRELFEETGLKVSRVIDVSPPIYSSAGLTDECCRIVVVEASGEISTKHQEEDENIETYLMSKSELEKLANRIGKYKNAKIGAKAWFYLKHNEELFKQ
jgi:ADP-ribose pyrophosphatase